MPTHRGTYFERIGTGSPIVLIVGFGQDSTAWTFVTELLKNQYELVLIDNRGCGRSGHPTEPFTVDDLADDVARVLDHLQLSNVPVVGQSMGGAIAQRLTLTRPDLVSRLALVNSFDRLDDVALIALASLGDLLSHDAALADVVKCMIPWVYSAEFLAPDGRLDEIIGAAEANPYPQPVHSYHNQLGALDNFDSRADVSRVTVPALVIAGVHDRMVPLSQSQRLAGLLPDSELVEIPAGHGSHIERPDLVATAIADWV